MEKVKQKLRVSAACLVAVVLTGVAINTSNPKNTSAAPTSGCYDVEFIWARGSGSGMGAAEYRAFERDIRQQLEAAEFKGVARFYELGTSVNGYPAQKVFEPNLSGLGVVAGAKLSAGAAFAYGDSVKLGVDELQNYINTRLVACPRTYFALGGYSQGAQVIGDTLVKLPEAIDTQVLYSVLYGDPKLYLPEGASWSPSGVRQIPPACKGEGLSGYRGHVPKCQTHEGVLGGRRPYLQKFQTNKVATYCNAEDLICGSTRNTLQPLAWGGHEAYIRNGLIKDGAQRILGAVRAQLPALFMPDFMGYSPNTITPGQDVAILLDTTGSMNESFNEFALVIQEVRGLAERVLNSGGRVAIVEYRDLGYLFNGTPSRVLCDFETCTDIDEVWQRLMGLSALGGGDANEALLHGIKTAYEELEWREGASKALVVFTDAGFHNPDRASGWTMEDVQQASIALNPVNIYIAKLLHEYGPEPRELHPEQLEQLKQLAELTSGEVIDIIGDGKSLSQMLEEITSRPIARLKSSSYYATVGQEITFDATGSTGIAAEIAYADWDFDGDGVFEISGEAMGQASLIWTQAFDKVGSHYMQARVVDRNGLSKTISATVHISAEPAGPDAFIGEMWVNASRMVDDEGIEYLYVNWPQSLGAGAYLLSINDVPIGYFGKATGVINDVRVYDVDFSKDVVVRLQLITPEGYLADGYLSEHLGEAHNGRRSFYTGEVEEEFDWSEALAALAAVEQEEDEDDETGEGDSTGSNDESSQTDPSDTTSTDSIASEPSGLLPQTRRRPTLSSQDGRVSFSPAGSERSEEADLEDSESSSGLDSRGPAYENFSESEVEVEVPNASRKGRRDTRLLVVLAMVGVLAGLSIWLIWFRRRKKQQES
ncbi:cutinase family protein [Candidatus Saccharibacteria bacterium]|nr:cutinase family protein [Candidatus Saccharibacteria bacterium]